MSDFFCPGEIILFVEMLLKASRRSVHLIRAVASSNGSAFKRFLSPLSTVAENLAEEHPVTASLSNLNTATHDESTTVSPYSIEVDTMGPLPPMQCPVAAKFWSTYEPRTCSLDSIDTWDREALTTALRPLYIHRGAMDVAARSATIEKSLWPQARILRNQRNELHSETPLPIALIRARPLTLLQIVAKLRRIVLANPSQLFSDLAAFRDFVRAAARAGAAGGSLHGDFLENACAPLAVAVAKDVFPELLAVRPAGPRASELGAGRNEPPHVPPCHCAEGE